MNEHTKMQAQKTIKSLTVLPNKSILQRAAVNPTLVHQVLPVVHALYGKLGNLKG